MLHIRFSLAWLPFCLSLDFFFYPLFSKSVFSKSLDITNANCSKEERYWISEFLCCCLCYFLPTRLFGCFYCLRKFIISLSFTFRCSMWFIVEKVYLLFVMKICLYFFKARKVWPLKHLWFLLHHFYINWSSKKPTLCHNNKPCSLLTNHFRRSIKIWH